MVTLFLLKTGDRNHKKTVTGRSMMKLNPHNFKIRICEKVSNSFFFFIIYRKPVLSGHDHHDFIIIYCNTPNITSFYRDWKNVCSVRQKKRGRGDKKPTRNNYGKLLVEEIAKRLIDNFGFWNLWRSTIRDWGEMTLLLWVSSGREENLAIMMFVRRGLTRSSSHRSD